MTPVRIDRDAAIRAVVGGSPSAWDRQRTRRLRAIIDIAVSGMYSGSQRRRGAPWHRPASTSRCWRSAAQGRWWPMFLARELGMRAYRRSRRRPACSARLAV